jgi:heme exporter protein C
MKRAALKMGRAVLPWVTGLAVIAALYAALVLAPAERTMGLVQRIFYFHVAFAWNAFAAFFVVFVAGVAYLGTRDRRWDHTALASAEIGLLFTTIVLVTGPLWAKAVWNVWWDWEPRLTTTLVLWFIYAAYLILRGADRGGSADGGGAGGGGGGGGGGAASGAGGGGEREAVLAAVFGIIGFVDVPIVFMSIRWWRGLHPVIISAGKMEMAPGMVRALLVSVVAVALLYVCLLDLRLRLARARDLSRCPRAP